MENIQKTISENNTEHSFDNGEIGAIGSVASAGAALGAAVGVGAGPPGLLIGAAVGGTVGAVGSLMVAEEKGHSHSFYNRIWFRFRAFYRNIKNM